MLPSILRELSELSNENLLLLSNGRKGSDIFVMKLSSMLVYFPYLPLSKFSSRYVLYISRSGESFGSEMPLVNLKTLVL